MRGLARPHVAMNTWPTIEKVDVGHLRLTSYTELPSVYVCKQNVAPDAIRYPGHSCSIFVRRRLRVLLVEPLAKAVVAAVLDRSNHYNCLRCNSCN